MAFYSQFANCEFEQNPYFRSMRKHTGMRPQDIPILVKVFLAQPGVWLKKDIARELYISASEITESLHRSKVAGLLDDRQQRVMTQNFLEFLFFGVRFVFPQKPGSIERGVPAAHSHPELKKHFIHDIQYVWPSTLGRVIGVSIEPFYRNQVKAVQQDQQLYLILSLLELLRGAKPREVNYAREQLQKIFQHQA